MSFWDAEKIKAGRRAFQITQYDLAEELGTNQQLISEWERGLRKPGRAYQKLLSVAFEAIAKKKETNAITSVEIEEKN